VELHFEERVASGSNGEDWLTVPMTAEERRRGRRVLEPEAGVVLRLLLPRGSVLRDGDRLAAREDGRTLRIVAAEEPVMLITADTPHDLYKAAYHLGNRHVALEVGPDYLKCAPDPVLGHMLIQLGVQWRQELAPFEPEVGAYGHAH